MVEYLSDVFGFQGELLSPEGWEELLESAGMKDLMVRTYVLEILSDRKEDLKEVLRVWHKVLYMVLHNPTFRGFLKESMSIPKNLLEYFGYGLYVGWK